MTIRSTIGRALAVFVVAGLVLVPMVRPAMAVPTATAMHATMNDAIAASSVPADAAEDMPCCPNELPDCSKDCPLMASCAAAPLYLVSQTSLIVPLTFVSIIFPGDPPDLVSITYTPPRKPPKI
jgi:hypothetical protein